MMPKHAPTPWHVQRWEMSTIVASENRAICSLKNRLRDDNAEFIVRACNSFEALLDACQQAYLQIEHMQSEFKETGAGNAVRAQIQRAIQLARKGTL